jgi:hypothetical protein
MTDQSTALTTLHEGEDVPALFAAEGGIDKLVSKIEKDTRAVAQDYSTDKGRKAARSLASLVSRSKTFIDDAGKKLNEDRLAANKLVNTNRNLAKDRLDALRDELKKPAEEFEAKEAERVRLHLLKMDKFNPGDLTSQNTTAELQAKVDLLEAVVIDKSWEEYEAESRIQRALALDKFRADLVIAQAREDAAAELEELRADKAQRAEDDRKQQEAEAVKAEAEHAVKVKAETEEAARVEVEKKAKADAEEREERHKRELQEAKDREEKAAQAERDRIADEERKKAEAEAARAADKKHRLKVRSEIVKGITDLKPENYEEIVDAMIWDKIPHVKVSM